MRILWSSLERRKTTAVCFSLTVREMLGRSQRARWRRTIVTSLQDTIMCYMLIMCAIRKSADLSGWGVDWCRITGATLP